MVFGLVHIVLLSGHQFLGENRGKNCQGEQFVKCAILVKAKCGCTLYTSCIHFQNVLTESCFKLVAQILACLKINKDRRSDGKFNLR